MNNLNEQINALVTILKNEDIQNYAGESFWNLIQAVVFKDNFTGIEAAKDVKNLLFHMPTVLFWFALNGQSQKVAWLQTQ